MSFRLKNISQEESRRIAQRQIQTSEIEYVSSATTLNPSIPTTKLTFDGSYTVNLPNGRIGQQKIITVSGSNGPVTVAYNSGYSGTETTLEFYSTGDTAIFWASVNGWHTRTYID